MNDSFEGFEKPLANFSRLPHQLIAELPRFKSLAELKVVLYILRHTWGFDELYKRISLDEFEHGRKQVDGSRMDEGVGMTRPSIISGLKQALEHGFIYAHTDDTDKARVKKFYSLTEQGLKSFTPEVKEFDSEVKEFNPSSKKVLPRTKKETDSKKLNEKESEEKMIAILITHMMFLASREDTTALTSAQYAQGTKLAKSLKEIQPPVSLDELNLIWDMWRKAHKDGFTMPWNHSDFHAYIQRYRRMQALKPQPVSLKDADSEIFASSEDRDEVLRLFNQALMGGKNVSS